MNNRNAKDDKCMELKLKQNKRISSTKRSDRPSLLKWIEERAFAMVLRGKSVITYQKQRWFSLVSATYEGLKKT